MKYVITDQGEVAVGGGFDCFHEFLAQPLKGRVVAAGHYKEENGEIEVFGKSIGFDIESKPEDKKMLEMYLSGDLNNMTE